MLRKSLVVSALLLCTAVFAAADDFNFTFNSGLHTATGTLVTTDLGGGEFQITDITNGMINGVAITTLDNFAGGDNLLFVPANPGYLDFNGFSFLDAAGNDWNIFYGSVPYELFGSDGSFDSLASFTITQVGPPPPVPEPGSLLLIGTGMLGAAGALRRKFIS